jgi:vacuolar-type H+-ATPase subunit H
MTQINAGASSEAQHEAARPPLPERVALARGHGLPIMNTRSNVSPDDAVEAAIAHVLQAERAARDAIAQAQAEASAIVTEARERARSLAERTERRMRDVRAAFEATTDARLADIAAAAAAIERRDAETTVDHARSSAAVAALAARLTGAEP